MISPNAVWSGASSIKGRTESTRMALLTFAVIGLQFCWGVEMTYCTPYLLELGLTKSRTSMVWVAGPLSGMIVAPVVGVLADRSTSPYGRRRPFMIGGSIVVAVCMLMLGWAMEVTQFFLGAAATKSVAIVVAVLTIYVLDFAINVVQWSSRSLIVDSLPTSKQQLGSAWASRMVAIGHLVGYSIGALDLESMFGMSQFKIMILFATTGLLVAVSITCYAVTERVLITDGQDSASRSGPFAILSEIFRTATHTPPRIKAVCWVQFWSWIGWFPFLFYSPTWVGEIFLKYEVQTHKLSKDHLGEIGRIGSMSLVVFSLVTFAGSFFLPMLVQSPQDDNRTFTPRPPAAVAPVVDFVESRKPTLLTAWTYSHLIFACSMGLAPFVTSLRFATILVAVCGIPWALASWAPFTFMGVEINRLSSASSLSRDSSRRSSNAGRDMETFKLEEAESSESAGLAGIYLGILNLFTTLPQFIGTFISMIVFSILEPGKSLEYTEEEHLHQAHKREGPNAISVCLFIGALCSLVAGYATSRLKHIH